MSRGPSTYPYYTCILVWALEYRSVLAIHNSPLECLFHYRPNLYFYLLPYFFLTNCKICFGETSEIAICVSDENYCCLERRETKYKEKPDAKEKVLNTF